jgi:hypothetical protein
MELTEVKHLWIRLKAAGKLYFSIRWKKLKEKYGTKDKSRNNELRKEADTLNFIQSVKTN